MKSLRVAHLTSVHAPFDARVFHKECRGLAERGFGVTLVCAGAESGEQGGVAIVGVPRPRGRIARMLIAPWRVLAAAQRLRPDIYHFHDPELIPAGLLLRLRGKRVVYDIHEDYVSSLYQKHYLSPRVSRLLGRLFGGLFDACERLAARAFRCVLAEKYYADRFPRGTLVLNYPRLASLPAGLQPPPEPERIRLLYTGGHWRDRGGAIHANLVNLMPEVEVHLVGWCKPAWAAELRALAGENAGRLHIEGAGVHLPYERILAQYIEGGWTAGLALFPPTEHYRRKELTKFFEYMGAGIPVLCSDFPVWKALIEGVGCGLCVDPADSAAVVQAIRWLDEHPGQARAMGERGRAAVEGRFNWERELDRLVEVYRGRVRA
jgi:glycosyltransferase involved in cell wall biosynthesis